MIKNIKNLPEWVPIIALILGGGVYLAQSWYYAQTQASVLDEGLYLFKGWLFASGQYTPFQDYGPWMNHMPLSFLIPGYFQKIFGPGLFTGRMLALLTGFLTLVGVWIISRRFGGAWWGAAAVWSVALNPAIIKIFSIQASQGLTACLIIWALVLTLGSDRPAWQLMLGSILAAAVPVTRINLLPFFPLLLAYVYWVHGQRCGIIAGASGIFVFILVHLIYWPGILRMWAAWLPGGLTPFLEAFKKPANDGSLWFPDIGFSSRLLSFLQAVRFHFVALMGFVGSLIFWPRRSQWKSDADWKTGVFFIVLFLILFFMHAWAALLKSYCVFCFSVYLSFFSLIGIFLLVITGSNWDESRKLARIVPLFILMTLPLLGFSAFNTVGASILEQRTIIQLLKINVPRVSGPGTIPIWGLLENRFNLDYETLVRESVVLGRMLVSSFIGLLLAGSILFITKKLRRPSGRFTPDTFHIFLIFGLLLSPTTFLGGGYRTYDCSGNVIAAYEAAGDHIQKLVPPDATLFWAAEISPVPLLYLSDVEIYPAQLNSVYSYKYGGDADQLFRYGHWNQALGENWIRESDVILISKFTQNEEIFRWLAPILNSNDFEEMAPTIPVHPCVQASQIQVFVRK